MERYYSVDRFVDGALVSNKIVSQDSFVETLKYLLLNNQYHQHDEGNQYKVEEGWVDESEEPCFKISMVEPDGTEVCYIYHRID